MRWTSHEKRRRPFVKEREGELFKAHLIACATQLICNVLSRSVIPRRAGCPVPSIRVRNLLKSLNVTEWAAAKCRGEADFCVSRERAAKKENGCNRYPPGTGQNHRTRLSLKDCTTQCLLH
jgi:hypothetical protein